MTEKTIAEIRALPDPLPDNYFFTTDKGQEGEWRYDSTDTSSQDNTGTVLVTSQGKRIKRILGSSYISVKWFGAKGDGIALDTPAIQATYNFCKTAGYTLYFDPGTYLVNTLNFNARVNIVGASTQKVELRPATNNMTVIEHHDSLERASRYTEYTSRLSNFTINGQGKLGIIGLRTYLTLASHFFQISIHDCDRYGLFAEGTQYSVFDQVICNNNFIGIRLTDDVHYDAPENPADGGGVNNEFRTCTTRYNAIGVMLGRPGNPHPFNLNRFTNLVSKGNKYTGLYALNTFTTVFTELGSENNALSSIESVTITNGGSGYTSAPTVEFLNSSITPAVVATGTATISGGMVTGVTITNAGEGYDRPEVKFTGGGATVPAVAVANLVNEYTVVENLGNIEGNPFIVTSVIKRSAVQAVGSHLSFQNYNHAQRNAYMYAENFSSIHIEGMTGAAILTKADETSSITVNNGKSGNGSALINTEVSQFNSPDFGAQLTVITAPRYVINKGFLNETLISKAPKSNDGTNTQILPYVTGSPYGGATETKFFPTVGNLNGNRLTLKLREESFINNDRIYVQCLIKSNVDTLLMVVVGATRINAQFQLHAGKWKRIVMVNKNVFGNDSWNVLRVYPLDTAGAVVSICNLACCTNLPEVDAELFIRDFQYNPNTPGGRDALYLAVPPTTGTWLTGDVVYNNDLSEQATLGWVCAAGGSPGVWKTMTEIGNPVQTIRGTASGNGTTAVFNFAHGLGAVPGWIGPANAGTADAANAGVKYVEADNVNLKVHVNTPPVTGTDNLIWDLQCKA